MTEHEAAELYRLRQLEQTMREIARTLYQHSCWNDLPWGPKQVLQRLADGD